MASEDNTSNITVTDRRGRPKNKSKSGQANNFQDNQERKQRLNQILTQAGNNIYGSRIDDLQLLGNDGVNHKDRIKMKEDPQIRFGLLVKKFTLLGQGWSIDPADSTTEKARFVDNNFRTEIGKSNKTVEISFLDKLRQILSCIDHGVSITEKIWDKNDDNDIVLRDLRTREKSLGDFRVTHDEHGNIKKLEQQNATADRIPLDKVIIFSYLNRGSEITGNSDLEAVWDSWFRKKTIKEFYSAYLELRSKINTVASIEDGRNLDDGLAEEVWQMLKNMQLGGRMIVPEGVDLDTIDMGQANENLFFKALKYWDGQILKGFLTPHLVGEASTEQSNTGSFALGQTHFSIFLLILKYLKRKLEDKVNEGVVKPLIDYNYTNVDNYPQFKINSFQTQETKSLAQTVKILIDSGVIDGDEDWIDDFVGIPTGKATSRAMLNTEGIDGVDTMVEEILETEEKLGMEQEQIINMFKNPEEYERIIEEEESEDEEDDTDDNEPDKSTGDSNE